MFEGFSVDINIGLNWFILYIHSLEKKYYVNERLYNTKVPS